jgi:His/Glu/Gln/Arg/opine family amino acid ABC transporter permease subunit
MKLDFGSLVQYWPVILSGFLLTLVVWAIALVLALALGTALATARLSRNRLTAWVALMLVEVIRDLPFMVILFMAFYLLPAIGVRVPAVDVGIATLGVYAAAYYAEIIRGAILSVPRGQMDSARATGMSRNQTFRHVIFPQMMGYFLPPATNQAIMIVKDSAILSTITVTELTMAAKIVMTYTFAPIEIFVVITVLYWTVCTSISHAGTRLEARLLRHLRTPAQRAQARS